MERREELCGPQKVWLHHVDEQDSEIGKPEPLTFDQCARKVKHFCARATETNLVERRDRIAAVRAASKEQAGDLLELFSDRRTQEVQAD